MINHVFMTIIAGHCLLGAGLFWLIHLQVPAVRSIRAWSLGNLVMGIAFCARLMSNLVAPEWQALSDLSFVAGGALLFYGCLELAHAENTSLMARATRIVTGVAIGTAIPVLVLQQLNSRWSAILVVAYLAMCYSLSATQFFSKSASWYKSRIMTAPSRTGGVLLAFLGCSTVVRLLDVLTAEGNTHLTAYATFYFGSAAIATFVGGYCLIWICFSLIRLELSVMANTDVLTGILNRRGLRRALKQHFEPGQPASMVFLQVDIDHFKNINDLHGHDAGDLVLVATANSLKASVRQEDVVARTGGEEFLIGLSHATKDQAIELAEAVRHRVEQTTVDGPDGMVLNAKVSVGISEPFSRLDDWEIANTQADKALYRAKSKGRNRAETFSDPDSAEMGLII